MGKNHLADGQPTAYGLQHRKWSNTSVINREFTNFRIKEEEIIIGN